MKSLGKQKPPAYLLSIDPSLASTGVSLFDLNNGKLLAFTTIRTKKTSTYTEDQDLYGRLAELHDKLIRFLGNHLADVVSVVVEDQFMQKNVSTLKKLAMVRALLVSPFIIRGVPIVTIPPRSWQMRIFGKESSGDSKSMSIDSVKEYALDADIELPNRLGSDAADAINIGRYAILEEMFCL